ncbi:hypothetical protein NRP21_17545 [Roseomonas pecuniae]|uniref:Uncharacterized protein n=1 Tax=Roseomonas populi TaxID=3121582 RepID=A0ABT1X6X8_9PROT|nr:hypothetical protein [Roseomonas pecuniae]MCR0983862.1 hypothetical protein [Roseomonas pecuniae]
MRSPHFALSPAAQGANSSGVPPTGSMAGGFSRISVAAESMIRRGSPESRWMIGCGVPPGAKKRKSVLAREPSSARVGTSGARELRPAPE